MDERPKLLLAEDDESISRLIAFKLGREGFEVIPVRDGGQALKMIETRVWAGAILDVMMPVHDGWEVLRAIRGSQSNKGVPVLILTAQPGPEALEMAARFGATEVLKKPMAPDELASTVRRMLGVQASAPAQAQADELREDFLVTLPERETALSLRLEELKRGAASGREGIRIVAHNLAGSAGSFGFPFLGEVGGLLDDFFAPSDQSFDPGAGREFAEYLFLALRRARETSIDPQELREDPRYGKLTSAAGSRS